MIHDSQYLGEGFKLVELEHQYGKNVHLLSHPFYQTMIHKFCREAVVQPEANRMVRELSSFLMTQAASALLPQKVERIQTRMKAFHPEAEYEAKVIDSSTRVVVVDLMRAGILPAQVCFELLHEVIFPKNLRQDHILLNRKTNEAGEVVGVHITGHKIGGPIQDAYVIFPDPMGATGSTLDGIMDVYEKNYGKPKKFIALHFIVTPEYLKRMRARADSLEIFALRLDRGLSAADVLRTKLGEKWSEERGLNERHYIVPGAGGIGEILNNSFV